MTTQYTVGYPAQLVWIRLWPHGIQRDKQQKVDHEAYSESCANYHYYKTMLDVYLYTVI